MDSVSMMQGAVGLMMRGVGFIRVPVLIVLRPAAAAPVKYLFVMRREASRV